MIPFRNHLHLLNDIVKWHPGGKVLVTESVSSVNLRRRLTMERIRLSNAVPPPNTSDRVPHTTFAARLMLLLSTTQTDSTIYNIKYIISIETKKRIEECTQMTGS